MSHRDSYLAVPRALAVLPGNGGVKGKSNKLDSVEVGSEESFYMLATFCFDLYRRMLYMAKPARALRDHIPPDLAREILEDDAAIDRGEGWRERAKTAQKIMLRLHEELSDEWARDLKRAARDDSPDGHKQEQSEVRGG